MPRADTVKPKKKKPIRPTKPTKPVMEEPSEDEELEQEDDFVDNDDVEETFHSSDEYEEPSAQEIIDKELLALEKQNVKDVFAEVGDRFFKKGYVLKYSIDRNGEFLFAHPHPLSWQQIHDKWGGGHYTVQVRRPDGTYFMQQTRSVAGEPKDPNKIPFQMPEQTVKEDKQPSLLETMAMLKQLTDSSRMDAQRSESGREQGLMTMLTTFMSMQKDTDKGTTQLILDMQKSTQALMDKMNENTMKMFEKISDRIEKVSEGKKGDIDALQLHKLMMDAEDRGYKKSLELLDRAEEMADEKAALMVGGGEGEGKEDFMQTALKAVAPLLARQGQAAVAPAQPVQAVPVQQPQRVMQAQPTRVVQPLVRRPGTVQPAQKKSSEEIRAIIAEHASPLLFQAMNENADTRKTAAKVLNTLGQKGVFKEDLLAHFTWDDIMGIVKEYKLENHVPWLEKFFGVLTTIEKGKLTKPSEGTKTSGVQSPITNGNGNGQSARTDYGVVKAIKEPSSEPRRSPKGTEVPAS